MKPTRLLPLLVGSLAGLSTATATDFIKLQNTTALNASGAWQNAAVPGTGDVLVWNSTYTTPGAATSLSQLGGNLSVLGLKVTNVGGTANAANTMVGFQNTSSAHTLTIGSGGIEMSTAAQALLIQSQVAIGASQSWDLKNANSNANPTGGNNGEDIAFSAQALGAFNFGGNTVTTSGAGQITITSGYTLSNGTLNVGNNLIVIQGGGNRLTTINSDLAINVASGSTLRLQSNSGALSSAAPITLNGGTLNFLSNNATNTVVQSGNVTVSSASTFAVTSANNAATTLSGNLLGSANLAINNTAGANTRFLQLAGNNSGYSGTITLGGTADRATRLTNSNAGSAAATWSVSAGHTLQLHNVSPTLGTLNGAGTVSTSLAGTSTLSVGAGAFSGTLANGTGTLALTKTTAGTLTLSGANTYTGATSVSAGTLLGTTGLSLASAVSVADGAAFGANVASLGTTHTVPSLSLGTTTGSSLLLNNLALANPTAAPLTVTGALSVNAPATIRLGGSNLTVASGIPLVSYGSLTGLGFGGFSLSLPFRVTGSLVHNSGASRIEANITGTATPTWQGNVNGVWDIDSVGDGSTGTANWTAASGPNTYVQAVGLGNDSVLFDDTATGPTTVSLSTTLSPGGVTVSNSSLPYTLSGPGKLSGTGALHKSGTSSLTLANTAANDYTGGTTVSGGSLILGDGATAGAGVISGSITNNGTLVLNRPDDHSFTNTLTGTGTFQKNQANTVTLAASALSTQTSLVLNSGKLSLTGGGTFSGVISGAGQLEASTSGTLILNGTSPNTNTGLTTVSGASSPILQLSNSGGTGVGGDITITGNGRVTTTLAGQLAPTATLTLLGSNTDSFIPGVSLAGETIAHVVVNSSVPGAGGGQIVMRNGMNVTGTATLSSGILGVASGQTATVNSVSITSAPGSDAILRIAGSGGPSTLNVGSGGITASGGAIQVKFNTNNQDATLNLGGDLTATGDLAITNAGYTGPNLNIINLTGDRTFDIASGTTTTVAPSVGGPGILTKAGDGTLVLNGAGSYASTTLTAGTLTAGRATSFGSGNITVAPGATLNLNGQAVTNTIVNNGGTLLNASAYAPTVTQTLNGTSSYSGTVGGDLLVASSGTLKGTATFNGAVTVENGGVHSPGNSPGLQSFAAGLSYDNGSTLDWEFVGDTLAIRGTDFDAIDVTGGDLTVTAGAVLRLIDLGSAVDYASADWDSSRAFTVIDHSGAGSSSGNFTLDTSLAGAFATEGLWSVANSGGDIILTWSPVPEPSTYAALAGLAALALAWKRRRAAKVTQAASL